MNAILLLIVRFCFPLALAATTVCKGLPGLAGGNCDALDVFTTTTLPEVAKLLLTIAAGLSLIFIVWGGIQMVMSMGDDSKLGQARWGVIYSLLGLFFALLAQVFVAGIKTEGVPVFNAATGAAPDKFVIELMKKVTTVLGYVFNTFFVLMIIFAGIRMIVGRGQPEEFTKGKKIIAWAIAGAIIVNAARTLLRAITTVIG